MKGGWREEWSLAKAGTDSHGPCEVGGAVATRPTVTGFRSFGATNEQEKDDREREEEIEEREREREREREIFLYSIFAH